MWGDFSAQNGSGGGGGGGGGFFNSPSQFGSATTPAEKSKKAKRNSRTAPLTISQALKSSDDGVKIWGTDIQVVCIVARILDINVQSAKIVYSIEDMTGKMKAIFWVDNESMDSGEDKSVPNVMVNTYVQIYGNIKTNRSKKFFMVYKMFNITDINTITCHYLQCLNNRQKLEMKSRGPKSENGMDVSHSNLPVNSMMNMDTTGSYGGLNQRQMLVFNIIRVAKLEEGVSRVDIQMALKDKMNKMELDKVLEWMCGEGHIYSTIDEDHFRATDAS